VTLSHRMGRYEYLCQRSEVKPSEQVQWRELSDRSLWEEAGRLLHLLYSPPHCLPLGMGVNYEHFKPRKTLLDLYSDIWETLLHLQSIHLLPSPPFPQSLENFWVICLAVDNPSRLSGASEGPVSWGQDNHSQVHMVHGITKPCALATPPFGLCLKGCTIFPKVSWYQINN
jgi:hypothetical protein